MGFNQRLYMYSRSNYFKIIEHEEKIEEYMKNLNDKVKNSSNSQKHDKDLDR